MTGAAEHGVHVEVLRIHGSKQHHRNDTWKSEKTVIIGAHQDSINLVLPSILAAPGADDDGSGTVTILEAFRVLASEEVVKGAANTIEFHWYSAEEEDLGVKQSSRSTRKTGEM
jgi:leucyl aminopeptidase